MQASVRTVSLAKHDTGGSDAGHSECLTLS